MPKLSTLVSLKNQTQQNEQQKKTPRGKQNKQTKNQTKTPTNKQTKIKSLMFFTSV